MEQSGYVGNSVGVVRRLMVVLAVMVLAVTATTVSAAASSQQPITITTSKPFGPVAGTFSVSGAVAHSAQMRNPVAHGEWIRAPTFLGSHLTILFIGANGTFTIKAQIVETVTADPMVLTDTGSWTIIAGTRAYVDLEGVGIISGTADDNLDLIRRTYMRSVHFD